MASSSSLASVLEVHLMVGRISSTPMDNESDPTCKTGFQIERDGKKFEGHTAALTNYAAKLICK